MSKKIPFGLVAVAMLTAFAHASQAEIRKAQLYRAEQLTSVDVALKQSDMQVRMQGRAFHEAVTKGDADALEALVGTTNVKAFQSRAPLAWDELEKQVLERSIRHVLDDDDDSGGPY